MILARAACGMGVDWSGLKENKTKSFVNVCYMEAQRVTSLAASYFCRQAVDRLGQWTLGMLIFDHETSPQLKMGTKHVNLAQKSKFLDSM